jgi:hypothetical protein
MATSCPVPPPAIGTAYRVLIERALNHEIVENFVGQQRTIKLKSPVKQIYYHATESDFVADRINSILELAKNPVKTAKELNRNDLPRRNAADAAYGGVVVGQQKDEFRAIHQALDALVNANLDDSLVVFYHGMRALIEDLEHRMKEKAFKAGWDGHIAWQAAHPGAAATNNDRDTAEQQYNPHAAGGLGHDTY